MANKKALMSSDRMDWGTPLELYEQLDEIFGFTLDVAASRENAKAPIYITEKQDGLATSWVDIVQPVVAWMNPPYGGALPAWLAKAYQEGQEGAIVVALVPARPDTGWFQYVWKAEALAFLRGRVTFEGAATGAPFPSVVAVFGRGLSRREVAKLGAIGKKGAQVVIP